MRTPGSRFASGVSRIDWLERASSHAERNAAAERVRFFRGQCRDGYERPELQRARAALGE